MQPQSAVPPRVRSLRTRRAPFALVALALPTLVIAAMSSAPRAEAAEAPVGLGSAATYSVLGGETVTNTGPSVLAADLGVSPGTAITGFPPGVHGGALHAADAASALAQADLTTAYVAAAGRASTATVSGDLVGQTLTTGVYRAASTLSLSGTVTLDGQGDPSAVFLFQVGSGLTTATGSNVLLVNGAQACRVFWQVGSSAVIGVGSSFTGTVLALSSISAGTGTQVEGRLLARNGAVTLDTTRVASPGCAATPPTTTTTTPASSTTAPTSSTTVTATTVTSSSTSIGSVSTTSPPAPTTTDVGVSTTDVGVSTTDVGATTTSQRVATTDAGVTTTQLGTATTTPITVTTTESTSTTSTGGSTTSGPTPSSALASTTVPVPTSSSGTVTTTTQPTVGTGATIAPTTTTIFPTLGTNQAAPTTDVAVAATGSVPTGSLPRTGTAVEPLLLTGFGLVGGGILVRRLGRRRPARVA